MEIMEKGSNAEVTLRIRGTFSFLFYYFLFNGMM